MDADFIIQLVIAAIIGMLGFFVLAYAAGVISGI